MTISGATLEWNEKIGRAQTLFDRQVPLEGFPEIRDPPQIHQRKRRGRPPRSEKLPKSEAASQDVADRTERRAKQKPEHRVVELVVPNADEIDVVGQTDRQRVAGWYGWNLDDPDARLSNPAAQHVDMQIECRDGRVLDRLTGRQKEADLFEEVVSDSQDRGAPSTHRNAGDAFYRWNTRLFGSRRQKRQQLSVNRYLHALVDHRARSMARAFGNSQWPVYTRSTWATGDYQIRIGQWHVASRRDYDIVNASGLVHFPRSLEELEELFNDCKLSVLDADADHDYRFRPAAAVGRDVEVRAMKSAMHETTYRACSSVSSG